MSTGIQWTDETWNPVVGCHQVSPGCAHCYAKAQHDMRHRARQAGKHVAPQYAHPFEVVQLKAERLRHPLAWRAPRRVFVNSVSDLFHEAVPDSFLDEVFAVMAIASRHTFQVLTKRPERMREYLSAPDRLEAIYAQWYSFSGEPREVDNWPLPNVWLGVSVENQRWADERIPLLADTPAAVRFLSCEPLLGPIDFYEAGSLGSEMGDPCAFSALHGEDGVDPPIPGIDWVIVGGESGTNARPFDIQWARTIVAACRSAGAAPFVKQIGAVPMLNGQPFAARQSHGADMDEWPEDLRVREFPAVGVRA